MAYKTVGLKTHIWNNNFMTFAMLLVLPGTLLFMVWMVFLGWFLTYPDSFARSARDYPYSYSDSIYDYGTHAFTMTLAYMPYVLVVVGVWYAIAWLFNRQIIMSATGAKEVSRKEEPVLYNLLENLSMSKGITMPRLGIIETDALNAFASGIDRGSYTVTVTRGLMDIMDKHELEAVIAHELTHIQNNDVRLMMVISIFAGMIGTVIALFKAPFSSGYGYHMGYGISSHGRSRDGGRLILFILGMMAVAFLASVVTNLVKLYVSRRREFMADAGAAELTGRPDAMIRALRKIEGHSEMPQMPSAVAEMCISPTSLRELWSTHPSTDSRIDALKAFAGYGLDESDYAIKYPEKEVIEQPAQQNVPNQQVNDIWDNPVTGAILTGTLAEMGQKAGTFGNRTKGNPGGMGLAAQVPSATKVQTAAQDPWGNEDAAPKAASQTVAPKPVPKTAARKPAKVAARARRSMESWADLPTPPRKTFGQR